MPAHAQIDTAGQLTDRARFVSDTIRISERGEARAGSLELIGWLMVVVALLSRSLAIAAVNLSAPQGRPTPSPLPPPP